MKEKRVPLSIATNLNSTMNTADKNVFEHRIYEVLQYLRTHVTYLQLLIFSVLALLITCI